ncbi:cytochrome P450 [Artomyces pyxidatus]|uniref:Cytochrome P450 n=1 Tax=Artomyces pyxidatus TaxID=48021 RepID=A0ACB8T8R1_9AGAM|nr:cytochrome P450 [Artomyces pyxidatus]
MLSTTVYLVALVTSIFLLATFTQRRKRRGLPYPPGPCPLPIVGNVFDVPRESSWLAYTEWAKTYGDVISLRVFGQVIVVLNSTKSARDLLEKRAAIYSARPDLPFFDLANWNQWYIVFLSADTSSWRLRRRMLDRGLRPSAAAQYWPMQKAKVHDFLKNLRSSPEDFRHHVEHLQGAIIMSLVYGYDVKDRDDPYVKDALDANTLGQAAILPGATIVNSLPFLRHFPEWLPGMGFHALARECERLGHKIVHRPFEFVKDSIRNGTVRLSITQANLQDLDETDTVGFQGTERAIAEASGSLYVAGADTTVSAIRKRLPSDEDRSRLPYVEALCKEVLRWRTVVPLGIPHVNTEDDVYKGYFIPKGSIIIANAWAILSDPRIYPDPDEFKPERFLTVDGQPRDDPTLMAAFGFGKRICPGRHLAENTLFIVAASLLATYSVGKVQDEHGNDISVGCGYTGGIITYPEDFKCSIVPRSEMAEGLIAAELWDS